MSRVSLVDQTVKNLPAIQETRVSFLCGFYPLEKEMATHSRILAWRIPWTEEPRWLQSMGSQRVGHDWVTTTFTFFAHLFPNSLFDYANGLRFIGFLSISTVQGEAAYQGSFMIWTSRPHELPGLPVHHQHPECTQIHVHWVGDAIQPSHPLSYPSPPALNLSQHPGLFKWVSSSHQVAKGLEFQLQHQSFQWTPRTDFL